ncbi:MAG TPA: ABC transporter ATP-binding protein [Bacteroidales bacterium]|nr:ABC transporter ATP-binding protein [Bacteroidales bacterium]HRZ76205.1 ABC transporter ATP-binding protein [Bacteroidales bacterium]
MPQDEQYIISAHGLRYAYGEQQAVDGIDLQIKTGEFFGLLGPNGAGKTTTISILSTLIIPDAGEVRINGFDLRSDRMQVRRAIGIVPQEIALYDDLSALENLVFWGRLYGLNNTDCRNLGSRLLAMAGLETRKHDRVGTFSGGMKRRVNLVSALMHQPKVLLMDEPTVGIDPQSRNHIFRMLEELHGQGITIIYTTHYMEEVEKLCSRAAIIDHGQIIALGSLDELRRISTNHSAIKIELVNAMPGGMDLALPQGCAISLQDKMLTISTPEPMMHLGIILEAVASAGGKVHRVELHAPDLETVFLDLTGRKLRDDPPTP